MDRKGSQLEWRYRLFLLGGACAIGRFAPERMCRGGGTWIWLGKELDKCTVMKWNRRHVRPDRSPIGRIPALGPRHRDVIPRRQAG